MHNKFKAIRIAQQVPRGNEAKKTVLQSSYLIGYENSEKRNNGSYDQLERVQLCFRWL